MMKLYSDKRRTAAKEVSMLECLELELEGGLVLREGAPKALGGDCSEIGHWCRFGGYS